MMTDPQWGLSSITDEECLSDDIAHLVARHRSIVPLGTIVGTLTDELALVIAKARTKGNVYMDGSHNPLPSERIAAKRFMDLVVANLRESLITNLRCTECGLPDQGHSDSHGFNPQPTLIALGEALGAIGYTEVRNTVTERNATGWTLRGDTAALGVDRLAKALCLRAEYVWANEREEERDNWRAEARAVLAALEADPLRPCARYWGSDGTLCSTHSGRFPTPADARCDLTTHRCLAPECPYEHGPENKKEWEQLARNPEFISGMNTAQKEYENGQFAPFKHVLPPPDFSLIEESDGNGGRYDVTHRPDLYHERIHHHDVNGIALWFDDVTGKIIGGPADD